MSISSSGVTQNSLESEVCTEKRVNARRSRLAGSAYAYAALLGLFSPYLALVFLDRRAWPWDEAFYGEYSIWLLRTLIHKPLQWPVAMLHAQPDRAPAISWIGQIFVPLGYALPYVQTGLLLCNLTAEFACIAGLYCALHKSFGTRLPALVSCYVAASASIFAAFVLHFFVEPLQCLSVIWLLVIFAFQDRISRPVLVMQTVAAIFFGLLVKTSSPLFQFPLVLLIGVELVRRKQGKRDLWTSRRAFYLTMVVTGVVVLGTSGWYVTNFQTALHHVIDAASGPAAIYYGSKGTLIHKLGFWLPQFQKAFLSIPVLIVLAGMLPASLYFRAVRKVAANSADVLALTSAAWIGAVLISFSLNINEDTRYLTALLPYVAVVVCWLVSNVRPKIFTYLLAAATLVQCGSVLAVQYGFTQASPSQNQYLQAYVKDASALQDCMFGAAQTFDVTPEHPAVVGVELADFDEVGLSFYSVVQGHKLDAGSWFYIGLDWAKNDPEVEWLRLSSMRPKYYLYRKYDSRLDNDTANRLAGREFARVVKDPAFHFDALKSNARVLTFEMRAGDSSRQADADRYRQQLLMAASDPSMHGVDILDNRSFGLLEFPRTASLVANDTLTHVEGWVVSPHKLRRLEIDLDGKYLTTAAYKSRPDVTKAFSQFPSTGFNVNVNFAPTVRGIHRLSAVAYDQDGSSRKIADIPVVIEPVDFQGVNPEGHLPFGLLEVPQSGATIPAFGYLSVRGWAVAATEIRRIAISVDGKDTAASWMNRPDVHRAYPLFRSNGFVSTLNLQSLTAGDHQLSIECLAKDGSQRRIAQITIRRP